MVYPNTVIHDIAVEEIYMNPKSDYILKSIDIDGSRFGDFIGYLQKHLPFHCCQKRILFSTEICDVSISSSNIAKRPLQAQLLLCQLLYWTRGEKRIKGSGVPGGIAPLESHRQESFSYYDFFAEVLYACSLRGRQDLEPLSPRREDRSPWRTQ